MKSTAPQRKYIANLVANVGDDAKAREILTAAFALNDNTPWQIDETITQATNRLTKEAASKAIGDLKAAAEGPKTGDDNDEYATYRKTRDGQWVASLLPL